MARPAISSTQGAVSSDCLLIAHSSTFPEPLHIPCTGSHSLHRFAFPAPVHILLRFTFPTSMSPLHSMMAFLHSIMPAPVLSRSTLTSLAATAIFGFSASAAFSSAGAAAAAAAAASALAAEAAAKAAVCSSQQGH